MDTETRRALEAILFVVDEPVDLTELSQVLEVDRRDVQAELEALAATYEEQQRGFVLREIAGGWRMYTAPEAAPYVERWVLAGKSGRLTQAALETLAVIAYKQPISRHEIGEIRGVNPDGAVRTLSQRGLIEEVGRDEGPGQAILYGTSDLFLEKMGLRVLDDLPPLAEYLPESPAPDEPAASDVRRARKHLASGEDLPSTGRARWDAGDDPVTDADGDPDVEPGGHDEDAATHADGVDAARAAADEQRAADEARRAARRQQDEEMAGLTAALERAASAAVSQLKTAMQATEEAERDPDDGDPAPADGGAQRGERGE